MKASEIHVGNAYTARVGGKQQEVRIERKLPRGGWEALSLASNKKVRIKGPQQVLALVTPEASAEPAGQMQTATEMHESGQGGEDATEAASKPAAPAPKQKKAPGKSKRAANAEATAEKKLSCLDAAAAVLKSSGEPMQCKQMINAMFTAKLWHSDAPTPAATLYSAILREITTKGDSSRFKKTERGHFALNG